MKGMDSLFLSCTSSSSLSPTLCLCNLYYASAPHVDCGCWVSYSLEMLIDAISAEENGVVTTCELTTYEPDEDEETNEIVFNPNILVSKIIMKVCLLLPFPSTLPLLYHVYPS